MATDQPLSPQKDKLRKDQGATYQAALEFMKTEAAHASVEVDDYIITTACEEAEGMYHGRGENQLEWMIPDPDDNQHFEVIVQDKEDLRFLPGLEIHYKLFNGQNDLVWESDIPFIWHPFLLHYGINGKIPTEGDYTAEVTVGLPKFHRHDEFVGKRYPKTVTAKIGPVHLVPERSEHGGE